MRNRIQLWILFFFAFAAFPLAAAINGPAKTQSGQVSLADCYASRTGLDGD